MEEVINLKDKLEAYKDVLSKWPDERRYPRIIDNPDWDSGGEIITLLAGTNIAVMLTGFDKKSAMAWRVYAEIVYCIGYEAGMKATSRHGNIGLRILQKGD